MTYEESYMECKTIEELEKMIGQDIKTAMWLNPDRFKAIKEAGEKVANMRFNIIKNIDRE